MRTFKDTEGREWAVAVNVAAVKRVRDLVSLDLLDPEAIGRLAADPVLLCDTLYVLVKPKADERGVTDEAFGSALGGDVLDKATDALLEEIADFFPGHQRPILKRVLVKLHEVHQRETEFGLKMIDNGRLDALVEAEFASASTRIESAIASRASAASTPAPERSES